MKKITVSDYTVEQNGEGQTYPMREALAEVLFHPDLKLRAMDLIRRDDLARRISDCTEGVMLLEEAEYAMVRSAVEAVQGYTRNDVEFVRRVLNAETVDVIEAKGDTK